MALTPYTAAELFDWLAHRPVDFLLLDVRNGEEFGRFKVEGPHPFEMVNVPYMEFIEHEEESVARVPSGRPLRIVCAKEGSAKFVGEILENHGREDIGYLTRGIKSWGNLLVPVRVNPGDAFGLYQFRRPGKASCSYAVVSGGEMMVFDPAKDIDAYRAFAEEQGCRIVKTIETHRQADYISGSLPLSRATGAAIVAPQKDFEGARFDFEPAGDHRVHRFSGGGPEVEAIHTPGHTPGSTSYLVDARYLISGDTVFIHSIGRPDLGGMSEAWSAMLFETLREIILPMDEGVEVLPGHYMEWSEADDDLIFKETLGKIKEMNADIYSIDDKGRFFAFIEANTRAQPEEYARIREINAGMADVDPEQQDVLDLGKNECAASAMQQAS
jgi:glyoxylase-like metal-dependent hydrolase (beta-lactamase superfamily II)/rhodanese-related sulfurtransferase